MIKLKGSRARYFLLPLLAILNRPGFAQELFEKPQSDAQTRWVSPENPTGEKGKGGAINKGAKGNAYYIIAPGEKKIILDVKGAGVIRRIWMSGTAAVNPEQRRAVTIAMFWDGAVKPAVWAPIGDFFGGGLGMGPVYENSLFASPEGRSYNCTVPMPFRKSAKIEIANESASYVFLWFDINYLQLTAPDPSAMYFHAYWSRTPKTVLGRDFEILPTVNGTGRYIGSNIGVIGNPDYKGTWFGEGEVKIYLDGDKALPSLVGTGTEDYIGSGWGQGLFYGPYHGSLIADKNNDIYLFYRYHTYDPIYFYKDIKVTIQQIGSTSLQKILALQKQGANILALDILNFGNEDIMNVKKQPAHIRLLDLENAPDLASEHTIANVLNFYRGGDDVSSTAYFYLDRPESNLPGLSDLSLRLVDMKSKVFDKGIK